MLISRTLLIGLILAVGLTGCDNGQEKTLDGDPTGQTASADPDYAKPGFLTRMEDGRLWVFRAGQQALEYIDGPLPGDASIRPAAGPDGLTVKSTDMEIIDEYLLSTDTFIVRLQDGRMWVFRAGSQAWQNYLTSGPPADRVTRPLAGPDKRTIMAADGETLDDYLAAIED
jgi:hypothetical protein